MNRRLYQIISAALICSVALILSLLDRNEILVILLYALAFIIIGYNILYRAIRNCLRRKFFDENFLMSIATIGAIIIGEYAEAVLVMLFYQVGEYFQSLAVAKSRKSIAELMNIRPDYANLKQQDQIIRVDPYDVNIGDIIVIKPGEKVPLDGVVTSGNTTLDTANLTGESLPRRVNVGDEILSGCINVSGLIQVRVTSLFGQSTVNRILDLVENAVSEKSKTEDFITKFSRFYTPVVVIAALLLAITAPLLLGQDWNTWIYRALVFLVVSCPCALVLSVPLTFFSGIGRASRNGILFKGSNYIEALNKIDTIVFDKTGTLTVGKFAVQQIIAINTTEEELLALASHAEYYSTHPIATSIKDKYGRAIDVSIISQVEEIAGKGLIATVDGKSIAIGNLKLMTHLGLDITTIDSAATTVYIAQDQQYLGAILIADQLKSESVAAIKSLKKLGISSMILSGDNSKIVAQIAKELDTAYQAELLPDEKVYKVEELLAKKRGSIIFVGDGINDAPVLARADIGIAMGGIGSDATIDAADIILMNDNLEKIPQAIAIAKRTRTIARENIIFVMLVKISVLILSVFGIASIWLAIFADVGVTVIAVINAFRALGKLKLKKDFSKSSI